MDQGALKYLEAQKLEVCQELFNKPEEKVREQRNGSQQNACGDRKTETVNIVARSNSLRVLDNCLAAWLPDKESKKGVSPLKENLE